MLRSTLAVSVMGVMALAGSASAELAYGVTAQGRLVSFDTASPGTLLTGVGISGLASNESILGIDLRPNDGMVYALGSFNNHYRLNLTTGSATLVGALSQSLNGSTFGYDFNPTGPVALRIVSNTDFNYRMPTPGSNGTIIRDTDLAYVMGDAAFGVNPNITQVAYTNNVPGATSTVLYGIDSGRDTLVRFGSANAGTLNTVGALGMSWDPNVNVLGGFDISGSSGVAYAALQTVNTSETTLYTINLMTGAATNVGNIGGGETLTAFTIVPTPGAAAVFAAAGLAALRRRR